MIEASYDDYITVQDIISESDLGKIRDKLNKMGVSDENINMAIKLINREMNS